MDTSSRRVAKSGRSLATRNMADDTQNLRPDGSRKGTGWLGTLPLKYPDGKTGVASEYSIQSDAVQVNGQRIDFPSLVPTLTQEEIATMTGDVIPNKKPVPEGITQKAINHANEQLASGKSVFADEPMESVYAPPPPEPPSESQRPEWAEARKQERLLGRSSAKNKANWAASETPELAEPLHAADDPIGTPQASVPTLESISREMTGESIDERRVERAQERKAERQQRMAGFPGGLSTEARSGQQESAESPGGSPSLVAAMMGQQLSPDIVRDLLSQQTTEIVRQLEEIVKQNAGWSA